MRLYLIRHSDIYNSCCIVQFHSLCSAWFFLVERAKAVFVASPEKGTILYFIFIFSSLLIIISVHFSCGLLCFYSRTSKKWNILSEPFAWRAEFFSCSSSEAGTKLKKNSRKNRPSNDEASIWAFATKEKPFHFLVVHCLAIDCFLRQIFVSIYFLPWFRFRLLIFRLGFSICIAHFTSITNTISNGQ